MVSGRTAPNPLSRYVPRLLVEWLREAPDTTHRIITGTCVFADLSGFTAMTERLAAQGTAGAEETGDILNDVFEALLSSAYDFGAGLVKWGGDAVLLLFNGDSHAVRATRAAWVMQNTLARVGKVNTSRGPMRLQMSIGINTGDFHFMLVGDRFRELVVAGPAMTATSRLEAVAEAGQVLLGDSTAGLLEPGTTRAVAGGHLLLEPPDAPLLPRHSALEVDVDLSGLFDPAVEEHLMTSRGDFEHRTVAVGFIAAEGTDAILAADGTGALYAAVDEAVRTVQAAAEEHGVVVLATDVAADGIKMLLGSGVPTSPGDDATRVLHAVTAIVAAPGRLTRRSGAAHGRVFAGDFGAPFRGTYSLAGDIVNLGARLTYHADIGDVLATREVVDRANGSFVVRPVPAFTAKGKREPVHALSVSRRPAPADTPHSQLPLIGRAAELAALVAAEARAAAGHGVVTELIGDAGIGKSRLIAEYASVASVPLVRVDGDLYAPTRPYASVQHLVRSALAVTSTADPDAVAHALTAAVAKSAPSLAPWLPLLAIPAGTVVAATPEVDALDATTRAERLRRVTSELLGALMATPTALVFNDTHAMDDASVALIRQLCSDVPARPWSIVLSRRPDGSTEATFPNATAMALDALTLDDADALVVAASTIRIPAPRRAELSERSGGNPLFLRALAETVAAGGDPDALPSEIEDVLTAHMDRLSPDERAWLRTAAVLGIRVDPELLDEILDDPFDLSGSPRLLEYIRPDADGTLVFAHHLIQRTAYEALPFRRRRTLHARASYFIERQAGDNLADVADVLAIHCLRGQRFDAAWQYARMAGRRASDRYAPMEAATLFDIALDAATSIPGLPAGEVADAAEALAEARSVLGDPELTEQALKLARRHARRDPRRLGRISLLTASQRYRSGRYDDALRWVRRGRALLDRSDPADLRLLAELAELAGVVHHSRGSVAHAYRWAEIAAGEAQQCGDRQRAASALSQLALAKSQTGESWSAVDLSGSEDWNLATYAEILNRLGVAAYYQGDRSAAFDFYAEAEACGRRAGREARAATYAANRAEVLVDDGRFADAIPPLEAAIEQFRSTHAVAYLPFALALLGRAVEGTQGRGAATPYFEESLRFAVESADAEAQAEAKRLLGIT